MITNRSCRLQNPSLFHSRCQFILHLIRPQQFKRSHALFTQPAWPPWRLLVWFRLSIAPSDLHFLLSHPIPLPRSWFFSTYCSYTLRVTMSLNDSPSCYGDILDEMAVIRCERLSQLADLVFPHLTCLCAWECLCLCMFDQWSLLRLFNCAVHYQKKECFAWLSTSDAKKILQASGLHSGKLIQ